MILTVRDFSMHGLLNPGDQVEVDSGDSLSLGDFVVFVAGAGQSIKMVSGLPGMPIVQDGLHLDLNGQKIKLSNESAAYCWTDWLRYTNNVIPEGHIFVLGTHIDSIDSRRLGFILFEDIVGRATKINSN